MENKFLNLLLLGLIALGGTPIAAADSLASIAGSNVDQWDQALNRRDVEQVMALYTENAIVLQSNGQISQTRNAIRSFWELVFDTQSGEYSFDIEGIQKSSNKIILAATWSARNGLNSTPYGSVGHGYDGKMTNVLVRQDDGSWKAQVQRWN
ncbi:MAG: hypothetical protein DSY87_06215 [Methylococcus sp.]|nr:MAG: hypothetical protein DSY87_06215 [Methylococcus sp.]